MIHFVSIGNEKFEVIWERAPIVYMRSVQIKRESKRPDRLDALYSLTHLLQVRANMTLKYRNKKPRLSIEILLLLLQSPHSYHL